MAYEDLMPAQKRAFVVIVNAIVCDTKTKQFFFGGIGNGKTHLLNAIEEHFKTPGAYDRIPDPENPSISVDYARWLKENEANAEKSDERQIANREYYGEPDEQGGDD